MPGAPFLFTLSGLADEADADIPALPPLSDDAKAALRQEVGLADDYANMVGREVCAILLHHRLRIQAAVTEYVEPQIAAMLEELTRSLDSPFDLGSAPARSGRVAHGRALLRLPDPGGRGRASGGGSGVRWLQASALVAVWGCSSGQTSPFRAPGAARTELRAPAGVGRIRRRLPLRAGHAAPHVAVKVLPSDVHDADLLRMFNAEADVLAHLSAHPSIVTVYQAGISADGRPYIVMEYCPGSLAQRYRTERHPRRRGAHRSA